MQHGCPDFYLSDGKDAMGLGGQEKEEKGWLLGKSNRMSFFLEIADLKCRDNVLKVMPSRRLELQGEVRIDDKGFGSYLHGYRWNESNN